MIVIGDIDRIESGFAFVKVVEHETTYECYMLQPLTGRVKIDFPYSVGEQVVCILQDGRNIIIGSIYNNVDKRDSESEFEKVLFNSKKYRVKATEEIEESALTIKLNSNNILLNGGSNDGIMKIVSTLNKINRLETELNTLKSIINGWTPIPNDGGAAFKTAASAWASSNITLTTKSELENPKVKH